MDEELKKLLESAKTQGASDDNLHKLIDLYEADFSQKKPSMSQQTNIKSSTPSATNPPAVTAVSAPQQSFAPGILPGVTSSYSTLPQQSIAYGPGILSPSPGNPNSPIYPDYIQGEGLPSPITSIPINQNIGNPLMNKQTNAAPPLSYTPYFPQSDPLYNPQRTQTQVPYKR